MPIAIKPRVLIAGSVDAPATLDQLHSLADVFTVPFNGDADAVQKEIRSAVASHGPFAAFAFMIQPGSRTPPTWDKSTLSILKGVKMVTGTGAGFDRVDVEYLTSIGAMYANSPQVVGSSTADGALMLLLAALRGLTPQDLSTRAGNWRDFTARTKNWRKATVGIVGMGNIGLRVADMAAGLGMRVVYYNRRARDDTTHEWLSLDDLWARADAIILACPLTPATRHLVNRESLAKMRDGVVIVNIARGPVVDDDALIEALETGKVMRAALDVYTAEPKVHPGYLSNRNVTLSPHIAGAVDSITDEMNVEALDNVVSYLRTGVPNTPVNMNELRDSGIEIKRR